MGVFVRATIISLRTSMERNHSEKIAFSPAAVWKAHCNGEELRFHSFSVNSE